MSLVLFTCVFWGVLSGQPHVLEEPFFSFLLFSRGCNAFNAVSWRKSMYIYIYKSIYSYIWAGFHRSFECQFICQLWSPVLSLIKPWCCIFVGTCIMSSILEAKSVWVCETSRGKKLMTSCFLGKLTWNKDCGTSYQGVTTYVVFFLFLFFLSGAKWMHELNIFVSNSTRSKHALHPSPKPLQNANTVVF